ncbi:hypothetical protein F383_12723 [Gossypium arboreum]|uniref:Uncharacterized protein n=1 Tax=Gossypium arboreum TaxID=29729 RepID=A0A0B0PV13_GOSAR|nr:hypothetical protein F383_12723 [Gossypium arboreum]
MEKEKTYWEQRDQANWLRIRDRNTAFFHKFASQRRHMNRIRVLENDVGDITNNECEMEEIALNYFKNIFFHERGGKYGAYFF